MEFSEALLPLIGLTPLRLDRQYLCRALYYPFGLPRLTFVVGMILLKETHGTLIWEEADLAAALRVAAKSTEASSGAVQR